MQDGPANGRVGRRAGVRVFRYKGARDGGARGHRGEEARVRKMSVSVSFLVERVSIRTRLWQAQCITILVWKTNGRYTRLQGLPENFSC